MCYVLLALLALLQYPEAAAVFEAIPAGGRVPGLQPAAGEVEQFCTIALRYCRCNLWHHTDQSISPCSLSIFNVCFVQVQIVRTPQQQQQPAAATNRCDVQQPYK
jgi:hypothetical protein